MIMGNLHTTVEKLDTAQNTLQNRTEQNISFKYFHGDGTDYEAI